MRGRGDNGPAPHRGAHVLRGESERLLAKAAPPQDAKSQQIRDEAVRLADTGKDAGHHIGRVRVKHVALRNLLKRLGGVGHRRRQHLEHVARVPRHGVHVVTRRGLRDVFRWQRFQQLLLAPRGRLALLVSFAERGQQ